MKHYFLILPILVLMLVVGCTNNKTIEVEQNIKPTIVATTTILADAIRNLVGDEATVISLMGAGIDPHTYQPKPSDLDLLKNAKIIFYHGLHLEGKMVEIFEKLEQTQPVYAATKRIDKSKLLKASPDAEYYDPHIWFDVQLFIDLVESIKFDLVESTIFENSAEIHQNTKQYIEALTNTDAEIQQLMASIPKEKRFLISTHDAFEYFGEKYEVETYGIQGISTASEAGLKDISDMVNLVVDNNISVVFTEQSASSKTIQSVAEGAKSKGVELKIGTSLYTDALGSEPDADTYIEMVLWNAHTIHKFLSE